MSGGYRTSPGLAMQVKLGLAAPALRTATGALWRPAGLANRYREYLNVMHGVIRASVPLMELAARRCANLGPDDPVAAPIGEYLHGHIAQERGHDEWLLADLAALGADPEATLARPPAPAVARLAGAQYYWIEHYHPVAILGYIAVLEGNAPAPWLAARIAAAGVPAAALRTVRAHARLDTAHAGEVIAVLDELVLTPRQQSAVALSGLCTVAGLIEISAYIARAANGERHD